MGIIKVLDKQTANLIAAGEVVERPASVVKELVENAIDAGSSSVTIEIKNGGGTYLRVTDNGCGMSAEDAAACFERHATSKIASAADLSAIATMGFRGEALASIAAVARVELLTRQKDGVAGSLVRIEGGEIIERSEAGSPEGTTVIVRELFYNTPARKKFLKSDNTESAAVQSLVERLTLACPDISFRLIKDGREAFFSGGAGLSEAAATVFGREVAKELIPVEYENGGVRVTGLIGRPLAARANRNMQHFSVNRRIVRSKLFMFALEDGFKGSLMVERYPVCALEVSAEFSGVDVNVHPAKTEVKFADERRFYGAVYFAVKDALEKDKARPAFAIKQKPMTFETPAEKAEQTKFERIDVSEYLKKYAPKKNIDIMPQDWAYAQPSPKASVIAASTPEDIASLLGVKAEEKSENEPAEALPAETAIPSESREKQMEREPTAADETAEPEAPAFRYIGEIFKTYIIVETEDETIVIDKHAAAERILYEKLKAVGKEGASQRLMMPEVAPLTGEEFEAVRQNLAFLHDLGYELEDFGGNSFLVRGVPLLLCDAEPLLLLTEIAGKLLEGRGDATPDLYDEVLHSIACRASVKGGNKSSPEELRQLAAELLSAVDIKYCPHGRPVALTVTRGKLEKQFRR